MSNLELGNVYKCYSSETSSLKALPLSYVFQSTNMAMNNASNIIRSPSIDSLVNSSGQESSDELSDTDSLSETKSANRVTVEKDIEIFDEAASSERLQKCCNHINCSESCDFRETDEITSKRDESKLTDASVVPASGSVKNVRRTSIVINPDPRMETIIEEVEPKNLSVKEILARFETMRETAEVQKKSLNRYKLPR